MEEMLENSNPGLARRFQLSYAFHFEDFDDQQLREILELKLKKQGLDATEEAKNVAIETPFESSRSSQTLAMRAKSRT